MLHPLIVTLSPWLPTHTAPMDIVSVSVTSCMPSNYTHAHTHTHTLWMAGKMRRESSCPPSLQGFWKSGHQLQPTRASQTRLQSTSRPSIRPPQPPTLLFSLPGSVAFPLVIAVRWPAMCYKWDKLQRLGDVRVGGCEWVAMAASRQGTRRERVG